MLAGGYWPVPTSRNFYRTWTLACTLLWTMLAWETSDYHKVHRKVEGIVIDRESCFTAQPEFTKPTSFQYLNLGSHEQCKVTQLLQDQTSLFDSQFGLGCQGRSKGRHHWHRTKAHTFACQYHCAYSQSYDSLMSRDFVWHRTSPLSCLSTV